MKIRPSHWLALLVLVALWGSSYLMVSLALAFWTPTEITGLRVTSAALILVPAVLLMRRRFSTSIQSWVWLGMIAILGNCLPFFLISWGQQQVESGLAGILAGTTPLMVLVLAHFFLDDEPIKLRHGQAFAFGFAGIVVLMGPDSVAAMAGNVDRLLHELAVFAGAACYAIATVMARKMPPQHPIVVSAGVLILASGLMAPFTTGAGSEFVNASNGAMFAILFLGLLGTGVASILYFYLIVETGARFTSYLNYLVPVWAIILGGVVLDEQLRPNAILALGLIIAGMVVGQRKPKPVSGNK